MKAVGPFALMTVSRSAKKCAYCRGHSRRQFVVWRIWTTVGAFGCYSKSWVWKSQPNLTVPQSPRRLSCFLTSVDPFDSDRLRAKVGNPPSVRVHNFKLDKFAVVQVRAKVNPDAEYSTPLKHRSSVSGYPRT